MIFSRVTVLILTSLIILSCTVFDLMPTATPTPTRLPTSPPPASPTATRMPTLVGSVPTWWATDLTLPASVEFAGLVRGNPTWRTTELNADKLRDDIIARAQRAGYTATIVTKSVGAIYDLLFVKGQNAFALNLLVGSDHTILTGSRVGVFHLKVSGEVNFEVDLPMRSRVDMTPGSEISIGTAAPNPACRECEYFINIHIAPFKGVGTYDAKPGIAIIDLQVIPGLRFDQADYRWAQSCLVVVRDAQSGAFDCRGLQNVYDQTKRIDVSGNWQQPAE